MLVQRDARPTDRQPHVVIVGGGFAGLQAVRALARHPVRITLLDRQNYHVFEPLLYQVAAAALSAGDIAEPLRALLRPHRNVQVLLAEVVLVDAEARWVETADGQRIPYDYLILAAGSGYSYFAHPEWEAVAPRLKTIDDALEIRRRILMAFEVAEREPDPGARRSLLTFAVVGGGPTGVELAGAIAEIARHTIARDFRSIDPAESRVILVEAGPRVLPSYPPDLSASAERSLRALGVEVRTGTRVTDIAPGTITAGDEVIPAQVVLWAAGVKASHLGGNLRVPVDPSGRVVVDPTLAAPGHPEIYVVGDLAFFPKETGEPLPGVAQVAIQQGRAAAENVWRQIKGLPLRPFRYRDYGDMATIGRAAAVARIGRIHLSGLVAWLAWVFVHIYQLVGFDNRVLVLWQWAWLYLLHRRGARLITRGPGGEAVAELLEPRSRRQRMASRPSG